MNNPTRIMFGLWPIAGVTTIGVTNDDARATIEAAAQCGITKFDTAFSYGFAGESDRFLGEFLRNRRDQYTVISKVGQRWNPQRQRVIDGTPETLTADAETALQRIGIEQFDLLMLHCPDPQVPIEISAAAIAKLQQRGLCRKIGVCNVTPAQQRQFAKVAGCDAIQCPLNMLQQTSLEQLIPQCQEQSCDVYAFWVLMKGLLAGKISRDHVFAAGDARPKYEIFQGEQRERAHHVIDGLSGLARESNRTIAQLAIGWALSQPGVSGVLIGAHRPDQIQETAAATSLPHDLLVAIDALL
jgi:aryl-alcohol dehydrogenase-like predicted oxidoreductase